MKVLAGLAATASAVSKKSTTVYPFQSLKEPVIDYLQAWFPANPQAPYCGCQAALDPSLVALPAGGYINSTCRIRFPYAENQNYGKTDSQDPHFVSVASSFVVGRERSPNDSDDFYFTGFDEVSNADVLDVLVFYDRDDCFAPGFSEADVAEMEQHRVWEAYNISEAQGQAMCEFEIECHQHDGPLEGAFLGNFNYDIARSVQTYTVPVYGLHQGEEMEVNIMSYENEPNHCMNAAAHSGHGFAIGCSLNATATSDAVCSNQIVFTQNPCKYRGYKLKPDIKTV